MFEPWPRVSNFDEYGLLNGFLLKAVGTIQNLNSKFEFKYKFSMHLAVSFILFGIRSAGQTEPELNRKNRDHSKSSKLRESKRGFCPDFGAMLSDSLHCSPEITNYRYIDTVA